MNLYNYTNNDPVFYTDPDGEFALALAGVGAAGGFISGGSAVGVVNAWNPVGWVILGSIAVAAVGVTIYLAAEHTKRSGSKKKTNDKHTKPRPGRESEKKRQKRGWSSNPNKPK